MKINMQAGFKIVHDMPISDENCIAVFNYDRPFNKVENNSSWTSICLKTYRSPFMIGMWKLKKLNHEKTK